MATHAEDDFDTLMEWVLAFFMITGEGVPKVRLASPEKVASDIKACQRQTLLRPEALSPRIDCLNIRGAAFVGR